MIIVLYKQTIIMIIELLCRMGVVRFLFLNMSDQGKPISEMDNFLQALMGKITFLESLEPRGVDLKDFSGNLRELQKCPGA